VKNDQNYLHFDLLRVMMMLQLDLEIIEAGYLKARLLVLLPAPLAVH